MKTEHTTTVHAKCPNGGWDYYEVTVTLDGDAVLAFLEVEALEEACNVVRGEEMFQESLTQMLFGLLGHSVTTRGCHSNNSTTVVKAGGDE